MSEQKNYHYVGTRRGAAGMRGSSLSLPRAFPPNVDPETYQIEKVTDLLKRAAYFSIFNAPNPDNPSKPILLIPGIQFLMIAVEVNEELHRFEVTDKEPTAANGLRTTKRVGEPVANVHIRFTPIPWDFEAAPGKLPPPTLLIPFISQRIAMLDGQLTFKDRQQSGFKAFGTARTFPVNVGGKRQLRLGAAIQILEGLGKFKGLTGAFVINGYIEPPRGLALNLMVRVMDPTGRLQAHSALTPIRAIPDPDPDAAFLVFLAEIDPDRPITLNRSSDGRIVSAAVYELLRLAHIGFDTSTSYGIRSKTTEGSIIGSHCSTLFLYTDPMDPRPVSPIQDINGVFTFFDRQRKIIGTLNANMVEGRAFATELSGAPMQVLRISGFGPLISGTGQFANASGMMSLNGVLSLFPRTLSTLYVLRIVDPDGKFRAVANKAWS